MASSLVIKSHLFIFIHILQYNEATHNSLTKQKTGSNVNGTHNQSSMVEIVPYIIKYSSSLRHRTFFIFGIVMC